MNEICLICLNSNLKQPLKCEGCAKTFCAVCACLWKIQYDECPQKCSKPWNIIVENAELDGFILCPNCNRLGSIKCPKFSCRKMITYENVVCSKSLYCNFCKNILSLYKATNSDHKECDTWQNSFYFYCNTCDKKFCDCVLN